MSHPANQPLPKSERKIHKRSDANPVKRVYAINYNALTSQTQGTSTTYRASRTYPMNNSLFFLTYNLTPVYERGHRADTETEVGASPFAPGINRRNPAAGEPTRFQGRGTPVPVLPAEVQSSGRNGANYPVIRLGLDGRARSVRLTIREFTIADFDANAGALNHAFGAPVLLSGVRKEEGDVASGLRDAAIAQARQSPPQEQQQAGQVTRWWSSASGERGVRPKSRTSPPGRKTALTNCTTVLK